MPKKLTQEEVDKCLLSKGFVMVDKPYQNSRYKHTYQCSEGHQWSTKFDAIRNGNTNCPECSSSKRRLNVNEVNSRLSNRGIRLVGEYTNALRTDTKFVCDTGHTWTTTLNSVLNAGSGCAICSTERQKLSIDEINARLENRGICLVGEYVNSNTKAMFECGKGHRWEAMPGAVLHKNSCPHCKYRDLESTGVYVLFSPSMGTKIGISNNVFRRVNALGYNSAITDLYTFRVFEGLGYEKSLQVEKTAHEQFKQYNCNYSGFDGCTEFFQIKPEVAAEYLESIINE